MFVVTAALMQQKKMATSILDTENPVSADDKGKDKGKQP